METPNMQKQTQQEQEHGESSLSAATPEFIPYRNKEARRPHVRRPQACDDLDLVINWYRRENVGLYQKVWDMEDQVKALEEERQLLWNGVAYWYEGAVEERACLDLEKEFQANKISRLESTLGRWGMLLEKATWERDHLKDQLDKTREQGKVAKRRNLGKGLPPMGWEREAERTLEGEGHGGSMPVDGRGKGKGKAVNQEQ